MTKQLTDIINSYPPITLEEMGRVRLMNRVDTKYVATLDQLCQLLAIAKGKYRIQQIGSERNIPYSTCYFDTADCQMFVDHERGKSARQKVRIRVYEDSNTASLEVKTKDNHGRTHKKRTLADEGRELKPYDDFISLLTPYSADELRPKINNHFHRITLVNNQMTERLTIDTDLQFHNVTTGEDCSLDGIAIIELKRDGRVNSPVVTLLRDLRIHVSGFSKYCMGMALTNSHLRHNRIKPRLRTIVSQAREKTSAIQMSL